MRLAVLDDYADVFRRSPGYARLAGHEVVVYRDTEKNAERLAARLDGFDAVVLTQQRTALPRAVVDRLTTLRCVAQTGRQTGHLDLEALASRGVTVLTGSANGPSAPAELTWALILASRRHLLAEATALAQGRWQSTVGLGLAGSTLGVWAFGRIGARVAEVGRAFGMRVLCWGREGSAARARAAGFEVATSRDALLEAADVLTLHLPLTPETTGLLGGSELQRMKPTALLVNTSRARLLQPGALEAALDRGRPGFAALDVHDVEPADEAPFPGRANVLCTPHLGYVEQATLDEAYRQAIEGLLAWHAQRQTTEHQA